MDFFAAQDRARGRTRLLVAYFVMGVSGLIVALYVVVMVIFGFTRHRVNASWSGSNQGYDFAGTAQIPLWRPDIFGLVSLGTLIVVGGACAYKVAELHDGGSAVAESLGAHLVNRTTTVAGERRLLNVVEEMALASGVPVPKVYVMDEDAINAFAAGLRPENAAITVTRGALKYLTRDELQGVIGHEFSHVLNGDMRLNVQLIGAVFGLVVITVIGRQIVYSLQWGVGGRSRERGDPRLAIMVFGLALIVLGAIGVFFGRLIQSAVSRQREGLADASSVQFTRNPAGLASALKKIGGLGAGSRIQHAHVEETAHMFFAPALNGVFATHPPLPERIRELEPSWDGKFITPRALDGDSDTPATPPRLARTAAMAASVLTAPASLVAAAALANIREWRAGLPQEITSALADPAGCRALALALALSDDPARREEQLEGLREAGDPGGDAAARLAGTVAEAAPPGQRLPLLELALAGLDSVLPMDRASLLARLRDFTDFDRGPTLHEFALWRVAEYRLNPRPPKIGPSEPLIYRADVSVVLSALAHISTSSDAAAAPVFQSGLTALPALAGQLILTPRAEATTLRLAEACVRLEGAPFPLKKQLLEGAAQVAAHDGVIEPGEAELLRALAASLGCPLPPG